MEEFSYSNFFRFLSTQKIQVPLLETAIVQSGMIEHFLLTDSEGYIKKRVLQKPIPVLYHLQKLLDENDLKNRMRTEKSNKICYFYKKSKKTLIIDTKIKEILTRPKHVLNVDLVQRYVETLSVTDKPLVLNMNFVNHQYMAELFYGGIRVNDPILMNLVFDVAVVLINAFEVSKWKRVMRIEIEFLKESASRVLLCNVQMCLLVEAKYTVDFPLNKAEDIDSLLKSMPKNLISPKLTKPLKDTEKLPPLSQPHEKHLYTFKRGQLRNITSNLDSPIRITIPPIPKETPQSTESQNPEKKSPQTHSPISPLSKPSEKLLMKDLLKDFLPPPKSNSLSTLPEQRSFNKSPSDPQKRILQNKRTIGLNSVKTLPKLSRPQKGFGNNFIELVMNTYCKNKESFMDRSSEFGLACNISSEEFSRFLSNADLPQDLQGGFGERIAEESEASEMGTPVEPFPRKKFEFQFVNNILAKRKDIWLKKEKPVRERKEEKMLRMIMKGRKGRKKVSGKDLSTY